MPKSSAGTPSRRPTALLTQTAIPNRLPDRVHRRRLCCARAGSKGLPTSWQLPGSRLREFVLHHLRTAPINASIRFLANSLGECFAGRNARARRSGGARGWSAAWSALRCARITATTWREKFYISENASLSSCWCGVRSVRLAAFGGRSGGLERRACPIQPCTQCSRRRR